MSFIHIIIVVIVFWKMDILPLIKVSIFCCPGNSDPFQYLAVQATQIRAPKYIVDAASVRLYQDGTIKWVKTQLCWPNFCSKIHLHQQRPCFVGTAPGRIMTSTVGWTSGCSRWTPRHPRLLPFSSSSHQNYQECEVQIYSYGSSVKDYSLRWPNLSHTCSCFTSHPDGLQSPWPSRSRLQSLLDTAMAFHKDM